MPKGCLIEGVNDSKKLSEKKREKLYDDIIENAIAWGVGIKVNNVIDEINSLEATRLAMHEAIENLQVKPDFIFIDAEKKVDNDKRFLIETLKLALLPFAENVEIANPAREMTFTYNDKKYKIVLSCPRK